MSALRSLDVQAKPIRAFRVKTRLGGFLTLFALLVSFLVAYVKRARREPPVELVVDHHPAGTRVKFGFDVSLHFHPQTRVTHTMCANAFEVHSFDTLERMLPNNENRPDAVRVLFAGRLGRDACRLSGWLDLPVHSNKGSFRVVLKDHRLVESITGHSITALHTDPLPARLFQQPGVSLQAVSLNVLETSNRASDASSLAAKRDPFASLDNGGGSWQYFVKLVPTELRNAATNASERGHQIAATRHFTPFVESKRFQATPLVFWFEISPLKMVHVVNGAAGSASLLEDTLAMAGGALALAGMMRAFVERFERTGVVM